MDWNSIETLLAEAIKAGRITESDITDLLSKKPDIKLQDTIDLVHTLFCQKSHSMTCRYYDEQILVDGWTQPEHMRWKKATQILLDMSEATPATLQRDLKAIRTMVVDTWEGKPKNPVVVALYFISFIGGDQEFIDKAMWFIEETT